MSKSLRSLSGLDAGFLYLESAGTPMHVGSVMLIEVPLSRNNRNYDFQSLLIKHLQNRLSHAPALRRVLKESPLDLAHPMWVETATVNLKKHVLKRTLSSTGGLAKLHKLTGKLHAVQLDRKMPMWQFVVIENVEPGVIALYSKIHHALLDGQGGVALAQVLLDIEAKIPNKSNKKYLAEKVTPRLRKRDVTQTVLRSTVNQFAKLLRALPNTLKLAGEISSPSKIKNLRESILLAPRTKFNQQISSARSFATLSVPISTIKLVARGFHVSSNDVVMAMCSGALREILSKHAQLPKQSLIAAMPVSLREKGNTDSNNQVSMVQCSLATDIVGPIERLQAIRASTEQIKKRVATFKNMIPTDFPGLAAPIWASGLSRIWASGRIAEKLPPLANVIISNVPGPPFSLYLAGAKLRHYFPVSIVTHGLALNITVQAYAGSMEFGITACGDILKKPEVMAAALSRSLNEMNELLPK